MSMTQKGSEAAKILADQKRVSLFSNAVSGHEAGSTSILTGSKLGQADIGRVVHEVMDGVITRFSGASISASWTTTGRATLSRSIIDSVALSVATTLEGMVKTNPMANFVGHGLAEVIRGGSSTGEGGIQNDDSVNLGAPAIFGGEGSITKETISEFDGPNVKSHGIAGASRFLHVISNAARCVRGAIDASEPSRVVNAVNGRGCKNVTAAESLLQHIQLSSNGRIGEGSLSSIGNHVPNNGNREGFGLSSGIAAFRLEATFDISHFLGTGFSTANTGHTGSASRQRVGGTKGSSLNLAEESKRKKRSKKSHLGFSE